MEQRTSSLKITNKTENFLAKLTQKEKTQITDIRNAMSYHYKPQRHQKDPKRMLQNPTHINNTGKMGQFLKKHKLPLTHPL